jgi:adenylate cyclase
MLEFTYGWTNLDIDYDTRIIDQADRAITIASDNVLAFYVKGTYFYLSNRGVEALAAVDAGIAVNPNFAPLYGSRSGAEASLGRFEQAKFDAQQAMRLSPRDPLLGLLLAHLGDAEVGLGHYDAAIDEYHKAVDSGFHAYFAHSNLAAAYALNGKMEEAKVALAEARRLNHKLTVKWLIAHSPNLPPLFEGLRKAGLPEE